MLNIIDATCTPEGFEYKKGDEIIICRCEEITCGEIREAVYNGMLTINEVKKFTRAGMGLCQGQTCARLIRAIMANELDIPAREVAVLNSRAPARPVKLGVYARDTYDPDILL